MSARKPKIVYYWTQRFTSPDVNWRLVGANGEVLCQSTQGFRDKSDAVRSVDAVFSAFLGMTDEHGLLSGVRQVGPGRKPT